MEIGEYKVGKYGLENKTEGMYARTESGILGIICNSNVDEMINGPEIRTKDKIYCVKRDSIKDIKGNVIDLIEEKDILRYRLNNLSAIKIGEVKKYREARTRQEYLGVGGFGLEQIEILSIVTKERFKESEYVVN